MARIPYPDIEALPEDVRSFFGRIRPKLNIYRMLPHAETSLYGFMKLGNALLFKADLDPILRTGCANSPSGSACHLLRDHRGNAFGNLSFESYDALAKRPDLLVPYGPYAMPNLLLKALPSFQLGVTNWNDEEPTYITTDIAHAGGALFDVTSVSFTELSRWRAPWTRLVRLRTVEWRQFVSNDRRLTAVAVRPPEEEQGVNQQRATVLLKG